ncbi:MAG: family transcriptional regulator, cyclic receptor protein [Chloroflexota bacterium]|nr:family transcriptional regulator, cyclic receptor protein [Chloroflexota bacterium]
MISDIERVEIFQGLPEEVITAIENVSQVRRYDNNAPILWAGMECTAVYFILEGRVDVSRLSTQGREHVLERLGQGEGFNLVPIFLGKPLNPADVRAVSPVKLLVIQSVDFSRLLDRFPELLKSLTTYLSKRLLSMVDLSERLALFPVRQRLAAFLINQADMLEGEAARHWTQEDIARRLGTVRDVVGRALRKFEQEGLVRFQRDHIELLDRDKLQALADGRE